MKEYYKLEPETPGELGDKTKIDSSVHPPIIHELEFVFRGWLGDCIIECFPVYLITKKIAERLSENELSGFQINNANIRTTYPFNEVAINKALPKFEWLKVIGIEGQDDFFISENQLLVSHKALEIMNNEGLDNCEIHKYGTKY